jgi:C2 domain
VKLPSVAVALVATLSIVILASAGCKSSSADPPQDFCYAARSANLKCKEPSDCDATLGNNCTALPKALSASSLSAAKDCLDSGVCGVASCIARSTKSAAPTPAHAKLAEDFCTYCAPSIADCTTTFYKRGSKSAGLAVLAYSEEIAAAVDDACTGQDGCQAKFTSCAAGVIADKIGTDVDADVASCIAEAFSNDEPESPLGPDGKPQTVTCTARNCNGCCRDDKCEPGDVVSGCGVNASACQICSGAQQCLAGRCKEPCGPNNCNGCCDGDLCVDGNGTNACGSKGEKCDKCTGGFACSNHTCVDNSCLATCTNGCCSPTGCQPGNTAAACGTGGEGCVDCGAGRTCTAASCVLDRTSLWDFYVSFAVVPDVDKNAKAWDLLNGAPDPYLFAFSSEGTTSHSGATTSKTDSSVPFWQETPLTSVKASELLSNLSIEIWDYDELNNDDFIGGCAIPLTPALFDESLLSYIKCPASATGVPVELYYRLRPHK